MPQPKSTATEAKAATTTGARSKQSTGGRPPSEQTAANKRQAEQLFVELGYGVVEIAEMLKLNRKSVEAYKKQDDWENKRSLYNSGAFRHRMFVINQIQEIERKVEERKKDQSGSPHMDKDETKIYSDLQAQLRELEDGVPALHIKQIMEQMIRTYQDHEAEFDQLERKQLAELASRMVENEMATRQHNSNN